MQHASRTLKNGTRINLVVGKTEIPALLNDNASSRALIEKLPYSVRMHRYEHDYCGVMDGPLPYDQQDVRSGWLNGDIAFAIHGNYFTILFKDEELSGEFDGIVNLGILRSPLSVMDSLPADITVVIKLENPAAIDAQPTTR
ncbi:Cyclophilin-like [Paucidesulfovibrio gracilis DSM 16080]|uniref:Cyclophilin-like n=1 Tax=Paucidesulfovibrio gracilis DSM 16080 TaxID=1121449 RepID=A0A1T4W213_9BACT|nr:cyclophilin-like fold protein [Paucidesulfovibrio gracilis]SKA71283.1 Cyclophilin-like [Paucidesulfovibrio gracilis DSM 16080]